VYKYKPSANTDRAAASSEILTREDRDGLTRVSVGKFKPERDARAVLQQLYRAGYENAFINNEQARHIGTPDSALWVLKYHSYRDAMEQRLSAV
jgi:hypothetical protein